MYITSETEAWYQLATYAALRSQTVRTSNALDTASRDPTLHPLCLLWMFLFFIRSYTNMGFEAAQTVVRFIRQLPAGQWSYLNILIPQLEELGSTTFNDRMRTTVYDTYDDAVVDTCLSAYEGLTFGRRPGSRIVADRAAFLVAMLLSMYRITTGLLVGRPALATLRTNIWSTHAIERIAYHYNEIQTVLQTWSRPKIDFDASKCITYANVAQGPNGTCWMAAGLAMIWNSSSLMARLQAQSRVSGNRDAEILWNALTEMKATGEGLPSILGLEEHVGGAPMAGEPWPETEFGRLVWRRTKPELRNIKSHNGGEPLDFFVSLARVLGIIENGVATGVRAHGVPPRDANPCLLLRRYNHFEYEDNFYIAQHAPAHEFIGVFLGLDGHGACEIPCGTRGQGDSTICNSNRPGAQCLPVGQMRDAELTHYRNRSDPETRTCNAFVWISEAPPTNPVYYLLELKFAFDSVAETMADSYSEEWPCRDLSDDFWDRPVSASYADFLCNPDHTDVRRMLQKSALRHLACLCLTTISEAYRPSVYANSASAWRSLRQDYRTWSSRLGYIKPTRDTMSAFTQSTLDSVAQVGNALPPPGDDSLTPPAPVDVLFDALDKWGWPSERAEVCRLWHSLHVRDPGHNPDDRSSYESDLLDLLDRRVLYYPSTPNTRADTVVMGMNLEDCVTGIVTFMSTMGNRLRPQMITISQYHLVWIQMLQTVCVHMCDVGNLSPGSAMEVVMRAIACDLFPTHVLGASEMLTLGLLFYGQTNFEHFARDLEIVRQRNRHRTTPGWYMFDNWGRDARVIRDLIGIGRTILDPLTGVDSGWAMLSSYSFADCDTRYALHSTLYPYVQPFVIAV
jgi:hypothetical protein